MTLNRARIHALDSLQPIEPTQHANANPVLGRMPKNCFGAEAFNILIHFQPESYVSFCSDWVIPGDDQLQLFLQGATTARALYEWAQLLKWPHDMDENYLCDDDWGISWAELYLNFLHTTGCFFPIKLSGSGYNAIQVDFQSPEGLLAPRSKRSLASQTTCFQRGIAALRTLTDDRWFPTFAHGRVTSLKHLGWDIQVTGIPCRPILPQQALTMETVRKLISGPNHKRNLSDNMVERMDSPLLNIRKIDDLPMHERFKRYSTHMYVRRRGAAGG